MTPATPEPKIKKKLHKFIILLFLNFYILFNINCISLFSNIFKSFILNIINFRINIYLNCMFGQKLL